MSRSIGTRLQAIEVDDAALIGEEPPAPSPAPSAPRETQAQSALTGLLITSLKALSNRALVALGNLYALALAASTFWVYLTILGDPSPAQLVGAGMYSVFTIGCLFLRRR